MWSGELEEITITEHLNDLITISRSFKSPLYWAGLRTWELEQFKVQKQLQAAVIESTISEWAAPVLFTPKKDGKHRFCFNCLNLNTMTVIDTYLLPCMDEIIDSFGKAKVFTTLAAYSGCWQMNIRDQDRHKTTFVCHACVYQYREIPFWIANARKTFQCALDMIRKKFRWKTCLVYLDDVVMFSNTVEEQIKHVYEILTALYDALITYKLNKCAFFQDFIEYLGHSIKPGKLEADRTIMESLHQAKQLTAKSELCSFLKLCNVYRRFISNFTEVAYRLNQILKWATCPIGLNPNAFTIDD